VVKPSQVLFQLKVIHKLEGAGSNKYILYPIGSTGYVGATTIRRS